MNQKEVWNSIAKDWHEMKKDPSTIATKFVNGSKGKIVDFGSGSGRNLLNLKKSKKREIYLVDFSEKMLYLAKDRAKKLGLKIKIKKSALEKVDFKDDFFDAAIYIASLHCIETKKKRENSIRELYRILKPGAKAEIEVWNKDSNWFRNKPKEKFMNWGNKGKRYYYLYDEKELIDLFKKINFEIIEVGQIRSNIYLIVRKPL